MPFIFKTNFLATVILTAMFMFMLGSAWKDSATFDEQAHIPAGFGYITQLDYRLNPEHPPLIKSLSAISAWIFVRPHFPTDTTYWQDDINGQWAQGSKFIYDSGNDADKIIFWSRLPIMLLALFLGWLIFCFAKNRYGSSAALITLTFFSFSPTVLAHSRLVTTDLGAALGFFAGIISFIRFLDHPSWRNVLITGLILGAAQLIKFSLLILLPLYVLMLIVWIWTVPNLDLKNRFRSLFFLGSKSLVIGVVSLTFIWAAYGLFTWNYPQDRQYRDTETTLSNYGFRPPVDFNLALIKRKTTRPLGQYLFGVLMANQRQAGGNTTFFLEEVSSKGSRIYFPLMYLYKEPLAFHILSLLALWFSIIKIKKAFRNKSIGQLRAWASNNFMELSAIFFIVFYWALSIRSPLNIGVRHVLPTFPFIYLLVSRQITRWLHSHELNDPQTWSGWLNNIYQIFVKAIPKYFVAGVLLIWLILSSSSAFPFFMPYYNELAGGARGGYKIAVDSNYDWGQDLKRLKDFVEEKNIPKIALDYFGGGNPQYYLGEHYESWHSAKGPYHGWFAVSATIREGSFGKPKNDFIRKREDSYEWLRPFTPVAQVGYSIFVYNLP